MKALKGFISVSFLMLICFQLLHKTGYQLYFVLNQAVITEVHCENKARPEIKCDGKCHLRKYLEQEEAVAANDIEEQAPIKTPLPKPGKTKNWDLFSPNPILNAPLKGVQLLSSAHLSSQLIWFYQAEKGSLYISNSFHPPC